jgi:fibronectin type 3 domain-containing protein
VSFSPVASATSYDVYWSTTSSVDKLTGSQIKSVTSPYVHTGLTPGATYRYVVTAIGGCESAESAAVTAPVGIPDTGPPTVLDTSPPATGIGGDVQAAVVAVFSKLMNGATFTASTFLLTSGAMPVAGTVGYQGLTASFTPSSSLAYATSYTATVKGTVTDALGLAMGADFTWSFTTQPPPPTGLATLAGPGEMTLTWTPIVGASYYLVRSSSTSMGPYALAGRSTGPSFSQFSGLTNGNTYYYVVSAVTADGESPISAQASVTPLATALPAPSGVVGDARNGQVLVSWTSAGAGASYVVWRAASPGGPYVAVSAASASDGFTDATVANGTTYYYVVQNVGGGAGSYSAESAPLTPQATLPIAPTGVVATAGSTWAGLSWSAVTGATGYVVMRGTTPGGPYVTLAQPADTTFADTNAQNGTTYYYVVAASNATGWGAVSAEVSAAVAANLSPQTPVLTVVGSYNEVALSWTNAAGATFYQLERGTAHGGPYTVLGNFNSPVLDTPPVAGVPYYYVVTANDTGPTTISNEVSVTMTTGAPPPPTNVTAYAGNGTVTVTWDPVPGASQYWLYKSTAASGPWTSVGAGVGFSTQAGGLVNGTTHYFAVQAAGPVAPWSANSATASATPSATLPLAPPGLVILGGGNGEITFGWTPSTGATSYHVYRRTGGAWSSLGISASNDYHDIGLTNGVSYAYAVAAVNAAGEGAWSNSGAATALDVAPPAPSGLAAHPGNGAVTITWAPVPGASSYYLYRSTTPGGPYSGVGAALDINGISSTLANGTPYFYVVQAYGVPSLPGAVSAISAEVSATPLATLPGTAGVTATSGNGELTLQWPLVAGATGYNVYRHTTGTTWSLVGSPSGASYTDTTLTNDVAYTYAVAAVNAAGEGAWSSDVTATPTPVAPPAPTNVVVYPGNGAATITWDPVPGAASYYVYHASQPGGPYSGTSAAQGPYLTSFSLTNGAPIYYVVQAYSVAGGPVPHSAFSMEAAATPLASLPATPAQPTVTGGDTQTSSLWSVVSGATGYAIYRRDAGSWAKVGTSNDGAFDDFGLIDGTGYTYAVAAVNGAGAGAWSPLASVTPAATDGLAPTSVAMQPGNGMATLTWTPVPGATSYSIRHGTTAGGPYAAAVSSPDPYVKIAVTNGTTYYAVVQAQGTALGAYSAEVSGTPLASLPAAPSGLAATPASNQLTVSWAAVPAATTYLVYRRTGVGEWIYSGNTAATSLVDAGLLGATNYVYIVAAVTPAGTSPFSAEAQGATP